MTSAISFFISTSTNQLMTENMVDVLSEINTQNDPNVATAISNLRKMLKKTESYFNRIGAKKILVRDILKHLIVEGLKLIQLSGYPKNISPPL